jgi:hypothetical protein
MRSGKINPTLEGISEIAARKVVHFGNRNVQRGVGNNPAPRLRLRRSRGSENFI